MPLCKHVIIVAGEESGDQHAAAFVRELRASHPDIVFSGVGGQHMQAAGVNLVYDLANLSLTGVVDVVFNLHRIYRAEQQLHTHIKINPPQVLVLVDYPGFNLRLARWVKRTLPSTRIVYYISPQIWAWKPKRIRLIRRCVDHMAVIFPFETSLYRNAGVRTSFVGHPLIERVRGIQTKATSRAELGLPETKRLIALLPGSRPSEIRHHMPLLYETAKRLSQQYGDLHFVIPIADSIQTDQLRQYWPGDGPACTFIRGRALECVHCSDRVIVASGTASLECALLGKPMCIIYKSSLLNYLIASQVIRVRYLGLCNLLSNRMIVPELLQYDCNPTELTRIMMQLLNDHAFCTQMQINLNRLHALLTTDGAETCIAQVIETQLVPTLANGYSMDIHSAK